MLLLTGEECVCMLPSVCVCVCVCVCVHSVCCWNTHLCPVSQKFEIQICTVGNGVGRCSISFN